MTGYLKTTVVCVAKMPSPLGLRLLVCSKSGPFIPDYNARPPFPPRIIFAGNEHVRIPNACPGNRKSAPSPRNKAVRLFGRPSTISPDPGRWDRRESPEADCHSGRREYQGPERQRTGIDDVIANRAPSGRRNAMKSTKMMEFRNAILSPAMKPIMEVTVKKTPVTQWIGKTPITGWISLFWFSAQ